jgi:tetratricopeptide (TPR) repeat protein
MTIDQAIQLGLQHHQAGRLTEAESVYREVLRQVPNHPDALHLLGMVARRSGRPELALDLIQRAISANPSSADYRGNLGLVLLDQSKFEQAIAAFQQAIRLRPDFAQAWCNLGSAYSAQGKSQAAVEAFQTAIQINPRFFEAYCNLANTLTEQKQSGPAMAALKTALEINPNSADLNYNLGNLLRDRGEFAESIAPFQRAIDLDPNHLQARQNMGNSLRDLGRHAAAVDCYSQLIAIEPEHAEAHWNLSLTQLLLGDFKRGWVEHEWRLKCTSLSRPQDFGQPRWRGEPLDGCTILLHPEQGLGDVLQFVRYAPMVAARGGRVVLQCQRELQQLLTGVPGISLVISRGQQLPSFNLECPLLSLPFVFGTTLDSIPADVPYLFADPALSNLWQHKLGGITGRKVGLVWAGSKTHRNDRNRSIAASQLAALAAIPGVCFVSLQKDATPEQIAELNLGPKLIDHTADLHDFADTAGLIANLDLVISVDTSVAHLAGGMGKPVWLLLPFDPDWRWLLDREDSPWYPTMRLFRQREAENWSDVIARIADALR